MTTTTMRRRTAKVGGVGAMAARNRSHTYSSSEKLVAIRTRMGTIYAGPCSAISHHVPHSTPVIVLAETYCDIIDHNAICAPISDFDVKPIYNIALALAAALDALERHGSVAICCGGGCGRTGTVTSILLSYIENLEPSKAIEMFSKHRGKHCPETREQYETVAIVSELLRRHGPEKTLRLLAMIEKPWVIIVDGEEVECGSGVAPAGRLTRMILSLITSIWGAKRRTIEEVRDKLGDLYHVARDLCTLQQHVQLHDTYYHSIDPLGRL